MPARARAPSARRARTPSPGALDARAPSPPSSLGHPLPANALATFHELRAHPELAYLADSAFIHTGYRWARGYRAAAASLCTLHNETANVCSHLVGALLFAGALAALVAGGPAGVLRLGSPVVGGGGGGGGATGPAPPAWPLGVFFLGATACLGTSAAYHLLAPAGRAASRALQRADYAGISALIFTSNVPPIVYSFACEPRVAAAYLAVAAATNGACVALGLTDRFGSAEWRKARAAAYVLAGAAGAVPLLHVIARARRAGAGAAEAAAAQRFAGGVLAMGAQYIVGAALYALRIPERWAPGRWDFFGSHALFHVLVLSAAVTHWRTVEELYLARLAAAPCP
jgi:adiponectin receptor